MISTLFKPLPELASRFTLGFVFVESGWGKFQSLPKVISYFESLGIPMAHLQAPFVSGVELLAGLFILFGLYTRLASLPLIAIMLVAIRTAKWEDVTDISSLLGMSEFLYAVLLLWLAVYGARFFSLDQVIQGLQKRRR